MRSHTHSAPGRYIILVCVAAVGLFGGASVRSADPNPQPVKAIFDTDMLDDCDDAAALAVLHKLADLGEVEILACVSNCRDNEKASAATISAINIYYGRPQIPIGTYPGTDKKGRSRSSYTAKVRDEFPHQALPDDKQPTALSVYRKVLAAAPDASVTIISVGLFSNLSDLLKSPPDAISPLSGVDLIRAKVKQLVAMGGGFPRGNGDYNFNSDSLATQYTVANWPTPILFSGFEIGGKINTGKSLITTSPSNPVRRAYELHGSRKGHQSWDLTAVLAAVRDPRLYWDISPGGTCTVLGKSGNEWAPTPDRKHAYLIEKLPPQEVAKVLDDLISVPPALNKP